jgi:hypothetical protein
MNIIRILNSTAFYTVVFSFSLPTFGQVDSTASKTTANSNYIVDSSLIYRLEKVEKEVSQQKKRDSHFLVVGLATMGFVLTNNSVNQGGVIVFLMPIDLNLVLFYFGVMEKNYWLNLNHLGTVRQLALIGAIFLTLLDQD